MKKQKQVDPSLVVVYTRVSTDAEKQELGLEAQVQECKRWCSYQGKTIVGIFSDEISGASSMDSRPGMQAAMKAMSEHRAGILLAQKIDRFSREMGEAMNLLKSIRRLGATLVAVQSGGISDSASELMFNVLISFGQYERESIKGRILSAFKVKRGRNEYLGGRPPFGKSIAEVDKVKILVDNPEEQAQLQRLRELRLRGLSWRRVAEIASSEGIRWRTGKSMDPKWIRKIVSDEEGKKPPYGFRFDVASSELIPDEEEFVVLHWIMECHEKNIHPSQMLEVMKANGVKTRSGREPTVQWIRSNIERGAQLFVLPAAPLQDDKPTVEENNSEPSLELLV